MATASQVARQAEALRKRVTERELREAEAERAEQGFGTVNVEAWLQHRTDPTAVRIIEREADKPTALVLRMLVIPRERYLVEDAKPIEWFIPDPSAEPVVLPNGMTAQPVMRGPNLVELMAAPEHPTNQLHVPADVGSFVDTDGVLNLDLTAESVESVRDTLRAVPPQHDHIEFKHETIDLTAPQVEDDDFSADELAAIEADIKAMRQTHRASDDVGGERDQSADSRPEIDAGARSSNATPNDAPIGGDDAGSAPYSPETLALSGAAFYRATGMTREAAKRKRMDQLMAARMSAYAALQQVQREGY